MKFEDKRLMEDKHHTSQIQIFSLWRLYALTPSFWGSLQLQAVEKHQGSTTIHRNTWIYLCLLPARAHQDELHESSGRTHSPPTGDAVKLGQHTRGGPISRQTPPLVSAAQEALQFIYRKYLGFFILFKAPFFSVQQCHSPKSLVPHNERLVRSGLCSTTCPSPHKLHPVFFAGGRGKLLRNTFPSSPQSL